MAAKEEDIGYLKAQVAELIKRQQEDEQRIEDLEGWRASYALIASGWGGIMLTISTGFYFLSTYWDNVIAYLKGRP